MVLPTTKDGAYTYLRIPDRSIDDRDVVASFYTLYSKLPEAARASSAASSLTYTQALRTIALHRQSRLLVFVLSILQHLNDHNVGLLTHAALPPLPVKRTAESQVQDTLPAGTNMLLISPSLIRQPSTQVMTTHGKVGTLQKG